MGKLGWHDVERPSHADWRGQGDYLGSMSLFRPEHVRLVEHLLGKGHHEGSTGRQAWEATGRAVPEHTVYLILGEMGHRGLVERVTLGRKAVFRAL